MKMASSSSSVLAVAVLAALLAGAWCQDCQCPAPLEVKVMEGSGGKKLVVQLPSIKSQVVNLTMMDPANGDINADNLKGGGPDRDVFTFESKVRPLEGPFSIFLTSRDSFMNIVPTEYKVGKTYKGKVF